MGFLVFGGAPQGVEGWPVITREFRTKEKWTKNVK
jgi:hypothetical protein